MSFDVPVQSGEHNCGAECVDHHLVKPCVHLFTANWCGHCKEMKKKNKNMGYENPPPDTFYEHKEEEIISAKYRERMNVLGYPTIFFVRIKDGEMYKAEYRKSRLYDVVKDHYNDYVRNGPRKKNGIEYEEKL